jgi:hypothetical protein
MRLPFRSFRFFFFRPFVKYAFGDEEDALLDVEKVGDAGVESDDELLSDMICIRTSKRARRGIRAVRSFSGETTKVVVYAIVDGRVASCMGSLVNIFDRTKHVASQI